MPPRSATSINGSPGLAGKAMSLTGWLKPARAMSSGFVKKSGMKNSRRTLDILNEPSGPMPTDQTELRLSSSLAASHSCGSKLGPLQTE